MSSAVGAQAAQTSPSSDAASASVKFGPNDGSSSDRPSRHQLTSSPSVEVDCDGVPIRDGKKIDVKQLLGHAPQVDEEEEKEDAGGRSAGGATGGVAMATASSLVESFQPVDEEFIDYGDDEEDVWNDEEAALAGSRQRRSSLKTLLRPVSEAGTERREEPAPAACDSSASSGGEGSPDHARSKAVRFADSLGLGLADVRDLVNADEPPEVPASALRDLHVRRRKRSRSGLTMKLDFEQPGTDPGFVTRVLTEKIALENCVACVADRLSISGVVRVANVAFDKRVYVRYTLDGWLGVDHEADASYLTGSNDGPTDRFAFVLFPPHDGFSSPGCRLEFVLAYEAGGTTYWDNNGGLNYGVVCCQSAEGAAEQISPVSPIAAECQVHATGPC